MTQQAPLPAPGALFAALLLGLATAATAATGPPDAFGYTWADSADGCNAGRPQFIFARTLPGLTAASGPIALGSDMPFYGEAVNQIWVHPDGYVTFSAQSDGGRSPLPNATMPNHLIAAHWTAVDSADVTYQANLDPFRIEWVQHLSGGGDRTVDLLIHRDGSFDILWQEPRRRRTPLRHRAAPARLRRRHSGELRRLSLHEPAGDGPGARDQLQLHADGLPRQ